MSKDYKSSKRPAASSSKRGGGGGGTLAGLFIGLCMGLVIAVAAALYLNKAPNPFAGRLPDPAPAKPAPTPVAPEILAPTGSNNKLPVRPAQPAGTPPANQGKDAQPFTFYDILPEPAAETKPAAPAKPADAVPPATVQPARGSYLQVGAFQNEADADNLKARLALLGMEASIQTSEVEGKGVLHRVRLGPLTQAEEVDRVRAQLRVNNIDFTLIKQ